LKSNAAERRKKRRRCWYRKRRWPGALTKLTQNQFQVPGYQSCATAYSTTRVAQISVKGRAKWFSCYFLVIMSIKGNQAKPALARQSQGFKLLVSADGYTQVGRFLAD